MPRVRTITDQLRTAIRQAERRGLTRYRISKLTGLSQSNLSRFLAGEYSLRLENAAKIAAAVGKRLSLVDS